MPLVTRSGKSSRSVVLAGLHVHAVGVAAGAAPVGGLGTQQPRRIEVHRLAVILVHVLDRALLGLQQLRGIADIGQELLRLEVDDAAETGDQMGARRARSGRTKNP